MCSLESKEFFLYADVEAADGATAFIFTQNLVAKGRVASGGIWTIGGIGDAVGDTGGGTDVVVQRTGEVGSVPGGGVNPDGG